MVKSYISKKQPLAQDLTRAYNFVSDGFNKLYENMDSLIRENRLPDVEISISNESANRLCNMLDSLHHALIHKSIEIENNPILSDHVLSSYHIDHVVDIMLTRVVAAPDEFSYNDSNQLAAHVPEIFS